MKDRTQDHVPAARMQALLDERLGSAETTDLQEHIASCTRCRAEFEAWSVLFTELGDLGDMTPSAGFTERILDSVPSRAPVRLPMAARVRKWFDAIRPLRVGSHLGVSNLQQLLDGVLPEPRVVAMEAHLDGCRICREEMVSWRSVMRRLDGLARIEPPRGFTERVMAHIRIQNAWAVARPGRRERLRAWADSISPRSRRWVAGLAGAAVTPAATVALVAYQLFSLFSHRQVTLGNLASFVSLQVQDAFAAMAAGMGDGTVVGQIVSVAQILASSPSAIFAVLTVLTGLTVMAAWILYRNLVVMNPVSGRYAYFSI